MINVKKYLSGLKLGMLLQLTIGPMCLIVFNTAKNSGFLLAFTLVLAVTLVDAFYIILAGLGVSKLLSKKKFKIIFKIISSTILILFGVNTILKTYDINLIPGISLKLTAFNIFLQGLILTILNPTTIIFWGSILTTKIIDDNFSKEELNLFSYGLISSTLIFLSFIVILGMLLSNFIPDNISGILNVIVGVIIILFGIKMLIKKDKKSENISL